MAHQQQALSYESPFNTVLIHDLSLELLDGKLSSAEEVVHWLDRHGTDVDADSE